MFGDFRLWTAIGASSMGFGFLFFFVGLFFRIFGPGDTDSVFRLDRARALFWLGLVMLVGGYVMLATTSLLVLGLQYEILP